MPLALIGHPLKSTLGSDRPRALIGHSLRLACRSNWTFAQIGPRANRTSAQICPRPPSSTLVDEGKTFSDHINVDCSKTLPTIGVESEVSHCRICTVTFLRSESLSSCPTCGRFEELQTVTNEISLRLDRLEVALRDVRCVTPPDEPLGNHHTGAQ